MPAKKKITSWPVGIAAALAACVAPCVSAGAAPGPDCNSVLANAQPVFESTATLRGKGKQSWDVRLPARSPIVVSATEDGLDLVLEVARDGDGNLVGRAESPIARHGTQRVAFVTNEARTYAITVSGKEHADASGKAAIRVNVASEPAPSTCGAAIRELATADSKYAAAEYEVAVTAYRKAESLLSTTGPSLLLAQVQHAEAVILVELLRDWPGAKAAASRATASYEKAGDAYGREQARRAEAEARIELATDPHSAVGGALAGEEFSRIRAQLDQIAQFHAKRNEPYDEALALNNIGITYFHEGRFDNALRYFKRTVPLYERLKERPREAQVLMNIAVVEYELGRFADAASHFSAVRPLVQPEDDAALFAAIMINSGMSRWATGDHDAALRDLGEALSSAKSAQDKYAQAIALHNLGRVYDSLGDQDRALDFYQQALQLRTAELDPERREGSLQVIGNILRERGNTDEALRMHREALTLTTAPPARARVLLQIARDLGAMGQQREALEQLDPILRPPGIGNEVIRARALAIRGQYTSTEKDLRDAIAVFQRYELPVEEFDAWLALAQSMHERGKSEAAMAAVDKALALAEAVRLQSANPELRATLMQPLQPAFDLKITLLAEQYFSASAAADTPAARARIARAALATAERSRSRALADFQTLDFSAPDVPPQLVQQRRYVYRDLAARRFALASTIESKGPDDAQARTISADIALLRRQLDEIDARIGAASDKAADATQTGTRASLDTGALPADTAIVEYWLGKENAIAWVLTHNSVVMTRLGPTAAITNTARSFYDALRSFGSVPEERRITLGAQLYGMIVGPLASQILNKRRLVFVPDGALHYIPFAALRTRDAKFLIESHDIAGAASLEMLLNRRPASHRTPVRQMLVVADPVYGLDDLRLGTQAQPATEGRASVWPLSFLLRGSPADGRLARLPGTAREAATIASVFPPGTVDRLEGFAATRDGFLNAGLGRYQFIHVATHAIADSQVPQASALLLSRFDSRSREIDGRVLAADLINVQLNAQMVVLSACDTAMGKNISGEGLMGLRYVVLARGARAVVASMWPVADQVSAEQMARFYKALLQEQLRVAPALGDAMRTTIKGRFKDPGLWAAYALTVADLDGT